MKTKNENRKRSLNEIIFGMTVALMVLTQSLMAQETKAQRTLLKPGLSMSELWVPEMKINSIQGDIGTLVGFYGGRLIDRKVLIGISGGVNLTHPRVNYGYFGGICQYVFFPEKVVHFSAQLMLAYGTAKDYEDPKEGLLDNFWNISGEDFSVTEPGLNVEMNLTNNLTLVTGVSYRFVNHLDENNENLSVTRVTYKQMSGLNINIGLKFNKAVKK